MKRKAKRIIRKNLPFLEVFGIFFVPVSAIFIHRFSASMANWEAFCSGTFFGSVTVLTGMLTALGCWRFLRPVVHFWWKPGNPRH